VFFLKHERIKDRKTPPEGADLIMEVLSEGEQNRQRDLVKKKREYAQADVPEYWVIDPEDRRMIVFTRQNREYRIHGEFTSGQTVTSALLPEFEVPVDAVFAAGENAPQHSR